MRVRIGPGRYLPPLHTAAYLGDTAAIARLLDEGADLEERFDMEPVGTSGMTPLMVAADSDDRSVGAEPAAAVELLLARGADPRAVSGSGATALWYAAGRGDPARLAPLLVAGGDPREVAADGRTAVCQAAEAGSVAALQLLLDAGASPHPAGGPTVTASAEQIPLFQAAASGSAAAVQLLLDRGVPADARASDGRTALMEAGSAAVVTTLLAAGCPRDARDADGRSALDHALGGRRSWGRRDPGLALANLAATVTALLDAGMDLADCAPGNSWMALQMSQSLTLDSISATALQEASLDLAARDPEALPRYCESPFADGAVVQALLARGARVDARERDGWTALHFIAASRSYPAPRRPLLHLLVMAGLSVDARDAAGRTPLHVAADTDRFDPSTIGALLDLGADVDVRDETGATPLLLAAARGAMGRGVVAALLAGGADPTLALPDGRTARDLAAAAVDAALQPPISPSPAEPGTPPPQEWVAASQRQLARVAMMTLALLDQALGQAPAAVALPLPDLPPLVPVGFLAGYVWSVRERFRHEPDAAHIVEHLLLGSGRLRPTEEAAQQDGSWPLLHAIRALPVRFGPSGPETVAPPERLLDVAPPAAALDLTGYTMLGYEVVELPEGHLGTSPVLAHGSTGFLYYLVNRYCLFDDLGAAYDEALVCGMIQPEPGPYGVFEVWRKDDRGTGQRIARERLAAALATLAAGSMSGPVRLLRVHWVHWQFEGDDIEPAPPVPPALRHDARRLGLTLKVRTWRATRFLDEYQRLAGTPAAPELLLCATSLQKARLYGSGRTPPERAPWQRVWGIGTKDGICYIDPRAANYPAALRLVTHLPAPGPGSRSPLPPELAEPALAAVRAFHTSDWPTLRVLRDPVALVEQGVSTFSPMGEDAQILELAVVEGWVTGPLAGALVVGGFAGPAHVGRLATVTLWRQVAGVWRVLAITHDVVTAEDTFPILTRRLRQGRTAAAAAEPPAVAPARLVAPAPGRQAEPAAGEQFGDLVWQPSPSAEVVVEIVEITDETGNQLLIGPETGESDMRRLSTEELHSGLGSRVFRTWRVWSIARDGRIALSPTREFLY